MRARRNLHQARVPRRPAARQCGASPDDVGPGGRSLIAARVRLPFQPARWLWLSQLHRCDAVPPRPKLRLLLQAVAWTAEGGWPGMDVSTCIPAQPRCHAIGAQGRACTLHAGLPACLTRLEIAEGPVAAAEERPARGRRPEGRTSAASPSCAPARLVSEAAGRGSTRDRNQQQAPVWVSHSSLPSRQGPSALVRPPAHARTLPCSEKDCTVVRTDGSNLLLP